MTKIGIKVENSYSQILNSIDNPSVLAELDKALSFSVKGAFFTKAYQEGRWDGKKRLFSYSTFGFPTGLVSRVITILKNNGYSIVLQDKRTQPDKVFNFEFVYPYKLREYQKMIVKQAVEKHRGVLLLATGGGKTTCAMKIAQELGVRTLFIVNTKEALLDARRTAEQCFTKDVNKLIQVWGGGKRKTGEFMTIATMASVVSQGKRKEQVFQKGDDQLIFVDETHRVGAPTWLAAVMSIDAFYRFGLTGTAFRNDGGTMLLWAYSGRKFGEISSKQLQEEGFLAESIVYFVDVDKPKNLTPSMTYAEAYRVGVVENIYRNKLIAEIVATHKNRSILVVVERIEQGEKIEQLLKDLGIDCVYVSGTSKNRKEIKLDFESGKIRVLIATRIYNESADVPIIEVLINGAGGCSGIAVLQRIGRALRLKEGKDKALIYDFYDDFNWRLREHSLIRMRYIKREKHRLVVIKPIEIKGGARCQ